MTQTRARIIRKPVIHPRTAPIAAHQTRLAKDSQMMRNGGLVERKTIGEIADAHVVVGLREPFKDRQTMWIG